MQVGTGSLEDPLLISEPPHNRVHQAPNLW